MKKFTINCDFGGQFAPFAIYIGNPERNHHPLHFQSEWLSKQRGGTIPDEIMDAITKLQALADKNNVSLEELCVYALGAAQQNQSNTNAQNANQSDDNDADVNSDQNNSDNNKV
jgi:hypothetical protein